MIDWAQSTDQVTKYKLAEPIPVQVEHVAVEFIVEPFRQSDPFSSYYEDIRPVMPC